MTAESPSQAAAESPSSRLEPGVQQVKQDLQDPNTVALADATSSMEVLDELLAGLSVIYDGDPKLERGLKDYNREVDDYNSGNYGLAGSSFSQAESDFLQAERIYTERESQVPSELLDFVLTRQCQADNHVTASREMIKASGLADTSPEQASEHVRAANTTIDQTC